MAQVLVRRLQGSTHRDACALADMHENTAHEILTQLHQRWWLHPQLRDATVRALFAAGWSVRRISRQTPVSYSMAYRITRTTPETTCHEP
jgi:ribosomal protein S11